MFPGNNIWSTAVSIGAMWFFQGDHCLRSYDRDQCLVPPCVHFLCCWRFRCFRNLNTEQFLFLRRLNSLCYNRILLSYGAGIHLLELFIIHGLEIILEIQTWKKRTSEFSFKPWICLLSRNFFFPLGSKTTAGSAPSWFILFLHKSSNQLSCFATSFELLSLPHTCTSFFKFSVVLPIKYSEQSGAEFGRHLT